MESALAPVLLAQKQAVLKDTWGHLAPVHGKSYRGYIVFTKTAYGDLEIVDADFTDLPDSPWLFDAMNDFVFDDLKSLADGAVYRFEGTFRNYRFRGKRTTIYSPPPRLPSDASVFEHADTAELRAGVRR